MVDAEGGVVDASSAQTGDRLRCVLPDYVFGPTSDVRLVVEHILYGPLLQRVCLDRGCGYGAPTLRSANGAWSWYLGPDVGVGALHGAPVSFTFSADLCEAGDMSTYGGAIPWCQECQPGKFSPERGAFACSPCPRGTFAAAGASSCTACPPGESTTHVGSMDEEACQGACPVGTFGTDAGLAPCFPCPRGTFASAGGLTACQTCAPGFTTLQPNATSQVGATECEEACAAGYVGAFGLAPCSACPPGRFAPAAGLEECLPCRVGFFSIPGQPRCEECPSTCELALLTAGDDHTTALRTQCCLS